MIAKRAWCELCRFDDPVLARAVATSIAAMEFDVRLHAGPPPCVVQVIRDDWDDLADVVEEIIDEQVEFDRRLAEGRMAGRRVRVVVVITMVGAADLLLLLGLLN